MTNEEREQRDFLESQGIARLAMAVDKWHERAKAAERFLERLSTNAASKPQEIVSTGRLTVEEINAARDDGRMFVLEGGLGFVIRPMSQHPENFKWWDWKCQQQGCQSLAQTCGDEERRG